MRTDHQLFHTGVPLIDNQHEQYIGFVDELFGMCERLDVEQKVVDAALTKVLAYALEHFDAEESLMRSYGYPGYESHRVKHDEFRDEADHLCAMSKEDHTPDDQLIHLTKWLLEWFCEQTLMYDRALATFMAKQGKESPNH